MRNDTLYKLAAHFLRELGERYSVDGCNDFDLDEIVPDVDERRAIMFEFEKHNGTPQDFCPTADYRCVQNWMVSDLIAALLEAKAVRR